MKCDGLRECEINTRGLEQDPCFGTYKYYTTNHICIPAETSVTCQDGYSYLKCDNGRIQINTANYGRTDKTTCSEGRPSEQLQNTNCYSPNALAPVSKRKSLEQRCPNSVLEGRCPAEFNANLPQHTCLEVCSMPNYGVHFTKLLLHPLCSVGSSVICEHANNTLMCDQGTVIRIHSANYGRTDSNTCCTGRPASQLRLKLPGNGYLCKISLRLKSLTIYLFNFCWCEGKNSCSLVASNGVFSDPCTNTFKYPYVSYSCIHNCKCYCVQ
ncbi:L-rhamnose-binding lectin CSL2-like [Sinocyclocheilus rhinocerous]|uniref:L-rhamnose-binding lectin CSL2-like n=1 Tax=Sinocyclocheilus rhinocerous TaxID=307959 RepID=UPI0007BA63C5|nr:PREDICTED: L-rhamnose-binding lectin CSL2-like [Sinocyclocheilus rhinocerous]